MCLRCFFRSIRINHRNSTQDKNSYLFSTEMCRGNRLLLDWQPALDLNLSSDSFPVSKAVSEWLSTQAVATPVELCSAVIYWRTFHSPPHTDPETQCFEKFFQRWDDSTNRSTSSRKWCKAWKLEIFELYEDIASTNSRLDLIGRNSANWIKSHLAFNTSSSPCINTTTQFNSIREMMMIEYVPLWPDTGFYVRTASWRGHYSNGKRLRYGAAWVGFQPILGLEIKRYDYDWEI